MQDYQANSNKAKQKAVEETKPAADKPKKVVERVVTGEVVVKKKRLRHKFREVVLAADMGSVGNYVMFDVLIPALRNTIVDVSTKGIERMMFGDSAARIRRPIHGPGPSGGPRFSYETPVSRTYAYNDPRSQAIPVTARESRHSRKSQGRADYIIPNRGEAEYVLEMMQNIIDKYDICTVADLHVLLGLRAEYTDNDWGWISLVGAQLLQIREGYLLDLPPAEPIPGRQ